MFHPFQSCFEGLSYGCLANSLGFGNSYFTHSKKVVSIDAFCLLVRQGGNGSMELLSCELAFVNLIGRKGNEQGTVFDAIVTVKRVVCFVVMYAALMGLLCFAVFFKYVKYLIRIINV